MSAIATKQNILSLEFKSANGETSSIPMTGMGVIRIGRDPQNELCLANDQQVSRFHCEIFSQAGEVFIRKLSFKNYLLVNGEERSESALKYGDQLTVGNTIFNVTGNAAIQIQPSSPVKTNSLINFQKPQGNLKAVPPLQKLAGAANSPIQTSARMPQAVSTKQPLQPFQNISQSPPSIQDARGQQTQNPYTKKPLPKNKAPLGIGIVILIIGIGIYFLLSEKNKTNDALKLRSTEEIVKETNIINQQLNQLAEQQQKRGYDTPQYELAEQHYLKGIRDYRNGMYQRALSSFLAALSFFPDHVLSMRYAQLSRRKIDGQIQFNLLEGRKNRQRGFLRNCIDSMRKAQILIADIKDPRFSEAQRFIDDCRFKLEEKW
jgi:pSer/pThr/pTyr-binding forkhead associated (FHA) protein